MIYFSQIDVDSESDALEWHHGFARDDDAVYPRTPDEFADFVSLGMAWGAVNAHGAFVGLSYAAPGSGAWEIGGLAVEEEARRNGVGLILACLTLGNLLFEEDPLADEPPGPLRVIAHVLRDNDRPRTIIEKILRFNLVEHLTIPGEKLPRLRTDENGVIHGVRYEIGLPQTLEMLADWAEGWRGQSRTGEAVLIRLREGTTLNQWAEAFRRMAARIAAPSSER